ncbi:hypothetical protein OOT46_09470 [Aquabacterium sp. A7-Y]|uniref:hypothetical protein n=1 Tax=Aquabacterium sp. A7-Y TaxID=1349605 RepID=UPI00223E466F|nr:hypothetical protein [Aquabacterium sp. A7-Y]MCW7538076.1 hypothetical protein [Aquabacterium sp. A7-Y]
MNITLTLGSLGGLRLGAADNLQPNGLEVSGLSLEPAADGRLQLRLERLAVRNLRLKAGPWCLDFSQATLTGVAATVSLPGEGRALELLGLAVDEVQLLGVRTARADVLPGEAAAPGPWRLEALSGTEGSLRAFITDAAWIVDADVQVPVRQGRLDFNRVVVEHIGPNSSMGISRGGLYVDAPNMGRNYLFLFTAANVPGAAWEQRGGLRGLRVTDRGSLDLRAFAEGVLAGSNQQQPLGKPAGRHVEDTLDRTRLSGELQLGDGVLGLGPQQLRLDGQAAGRNRVKLSAAVLSHQLVLRIAEFSARETAFELFGQSGGSAAVEADLTLHANGLGQTPKEKGPAPALAVSIGAMRLKQLRWGHPMPQAPAGPGSGSGR